MDLLMLEMTNDPLEVMAFAVLVKIRDKSS